MTLDLIVYQTDKMFVIAINISLHKCDNEKDLGKYRAILKSELKQDLHHVNLSGSYQWCYQANNLS